jgi:hypothetical protein
MREASVGCISTFWRGRILSGGQPLLRAAVEGAANNLECTRERAAPLPARSAMNSPGYERRSVNGAKSLCTHEL